MPKVKVRVPKMDESDYREADSFVYFYGDGWNDFLGRWNDRNISTDEAKGLLHVVADRLDGWAETFPESFGEDNRETCVRFLLYYASLPSTYDNEWQIIEKAQQVIVHKVLTSRYLEREASNELILDLLRYFAKDLKERLPKREPGRRKFEDFLRTADNRRNDEIKGLVTQLVTTLFRSKSAKL
ncbi:MAG: hypothetical protein Q7S12_01335 [bacterium]|nr:hypothetical protein [bacterium]